MARKYAQIRMSIWSDDDFLDLSPRGQHLYFVLLTDPTLSFCGVADWRPKRLAGRSKGWTVALVEQAADELAKANERYIVIDDDTEEVLVRSFIRNDEVLKQPNLAVAMVSAFSGVSSRELRGVIRDEVWRLSVDSPELACWSAKASAHLLEDMISKSPARRAGAEPSSPGNPFGNPFGKGIGHPSEHTRDTLSGGPKPFPEPIGTPSPPAPTPAPTPAPSPTETASTSDADEPAALLDVPAKAPTIGQRISRLSRLYTDQISLSPYHGVSQCVKAAITSGDYTDQQIESGLLVLVKERRSVTRNSLRIAIEGKPGDSKQIAQDKTDWDDPNTTF